MHRGKNFGAQYVLLNNNHPTALSHENLPHTDHPYEYFNQKYNEATRELAQELNGEVSFLDIEAHFHKLLKEGEEISTFLLEDGMHLGEAGHQVYYDLVNPLLTNAIKDLIGLESQS